VHRAVSGQHQYAVVDEEWAIFKWKENKTQKAKFFFIKDRTEDGGMKINQLPDGRNEGRCAN
jgi:hypothetical protein